MSGGVVGAVRMPLPVRPGAFLPAGGRSMKVFEDFEQRRVEDDSAIRTHDRERVTGRQSGAVASAGGKRVEYVCKAEDPCRKRNSVPG